jgi:hypothetical protein
LWDKYPLAVTQLGFAALGPVITMAFPKKYEMLKNHDYLLDFLVLGSVI